MKLANTIICASCGLERSGVDFQSPRRQPGVAPLALCIPCLGEAVNTTGGTVSKAEHDKVVDDLNTRTHAAKQVAADLKAAERELARMRPELERLSNEATNHHAHAGAQDAIIADQQAKIRAYERGEVPADELAAQAAAELEEALH